MTGPISSSISSAVPRQRTTLCGAIVSVAHDRHPWVRTDVAISDGTGTLVLRFVGRWSVPGLEVGRRLIVDGTPGVVDGKVVMLNPLYSFVASPADMDRP